MLDAQMHRPLKEAAASRASGTAAGAWCSSCTSVRQGREADDDTAISSCEDDGGIEEVRFEE